MKNFKAKVIVKMKPTIKDTKGQTIEHAINSFMQVQNLSCRAGNVYYFNFSAENEVEALHIIEKIASELLSNEVIETYEIRYLEELDE